MSREGHGAEKFDRGQGEVSTARRIATTMRYGEKVMRIIYVCILRAASFPVKMCSKESAWETWFNVPVPDASSSLLILSAAYAI